jgi:hypothetical protein
MVDKDLQLRITASRANRGILAVAELEVVAGDREQRRISDYFRLAIKDPIG